MKKLVFTAILDAGYWILDDELDLVYPVSFIQYRVSFTTDDKEPFFFQKNNDLIDNTINRFPI